MGGELDKVVEELRRLDSVGVQIAEDARAAVEAAARETAAAGTTAEGEPWAQTKDGRRALPKAAEAIRAVVSGASRAVITLVLTGPYVFHQQMKGKSQRRILFDPEVGVPAKIRDAIAASAKKVVGRVVTGGRS